MISMRKQILASMGPAMRCTVFGADINHTDFKHTQTEVNVSVEDFRPEWTKDFVEYSCSFTK